MQLDTASRLKSKVPELPDAVAQIGGKDASDKDWLLTLVAQNRDIVVNWMNRTIEATGYKNAVSDEGSGHFVLMNLQPKKTDRTETLAVKFVTLACNKPAEMSAIGAQIAAELTTRALAEGFGSILELFANKKQNKQTA